MSDRVKAEISWSQGKMTLNTWEAWEVTQTSGNKVLQWQCCQSYSLRKRAECLLYASVILDSQKNLETATGCAVNNADLESTVATECL